MISMLYRRFSILIAILLIAAACSGGTPAASGAPQASGGAASTLVYYADVSDLISLDPAVAYEFSGVLLVHNVYDTLVKFEGSDLSNLKPSLATSWDPKDAGSTWDITFKLKSGVKFASGNALTADDVVYSLQRVIKLNKSPAFLFTDIAGLKETSIKATDASTVVVSMPKTSSPQGFLSILTFTVAGIVDSKEVKSHETGGDSGSAWLLDHSAGSGPYSIDHWTKQSEVLLKANTNYGGTKPALSSVLVKHVPESTNQQFALEKGDADVARNLGPQQIAALQGKAGVTTTTGNSLVLVYVGMNATVKPQRQRARGAAHRDRLRRHHQGPAEGQRQEGPGHRARRPLRLQRSHAVPGRRDQGEVAARSGRADRGESGIPHPHRTGSGRRGVGGPRRQAAGRLGEDRRDGHDQADRTS